MDMKMVQDDVNLFTSNIYVKDIQVVTRISMRSGKITMGLRGTQDLWCRW